MYILHFDSHDAKRLKRHMTQDNGHNRTSQLQHEATVIGVPVRVESRQNKHLTMVYISADGSVGGKKTTWKLITEFLNSKCMNLFGNRLSLRYMRAQIGRKTVELVWRDAFSAFFASLRFAS
jgi:ABC-type antimicrobial peptide transport system ATPase subunit